MSSTDAETSPMGLEPVDAASAPTIVMAQGTEQRAQLGDAYLERVATLEAQIRRAESLEERTQLRRQAMDHLDSALQAYQAPAGQARVHFAKAVILADAAREEGRDQDRLEIVVQVVDHCQNALSLLYQDDRVSYPTLTGAHAAAAGLLLGVQELVKDERARQSLDRLIWAHGEEFGESLAWDIRQQTEGNDLLFVTGVLGALEELEEDPARRWDLAQSQRSSAAAAAVVLSHTGSLDEALQAAELSRQARERAKVIKDATSQPPVCDTCGTMNAVGHSFCVRCGTPLGPAEGGQGVICSSCSTLNRPANRFCTRCGFSLR